VLSKGELLNGFSQKDTFALTSCFRFGYNYWIIRGLEVLAKLVIFCRKGPGFRVEAIRVGKLFLHFVQVASQEVFA